MNVLKAIKEQQENLNCTIELINVSNIIIKSPYEIFMTASNVNFKGKDKSKFVNATLKINHINRNTCTFENVVGFTLSKNKVVYSDFITYYDFHDVSIRLGTKLNLGAIQMLNTLFDAETSMMPYVAAQEYYSDFK